MSTQDADYNLLESVVREIGGDEAVKVAALLDPTEETTDEAIAAGAEMKLNAVRKVLYRLYDARLAEFRRIRDKSTGWFIYFWRLKPNRVEELVISRKKTVYRKLKARLDYEEKYHFFKCDQDYCPRYTFDEAMENNFRCPECNGELRAFNNADIVKKLSEKVKELRKSLETSGVNIDVLNNGIDEDATHLMATNREVAAVDSSSNSSHGSK
ncbi:MAG: transcription factor [Candidatus Heimdallarchaeota archaeon]|nr:transcription factor [Candidatus Heimdallarchaeota archaeon]